MLYLPQVPPNNSFKPSPLRGLGAGARIVPWLRPLSTRPRTRDPMPYGTIALLAAIILSVRFVLATDASLRSKVVVSAVCLGSIAIGFLRPQWALFGLLLQVVLVVGLVIHAKLQS